MNGLESKKIAIITLYDNMNFGNRLQNYAVQRYLENLGFSCVMSPSLKWLDRNEPALINLCRRMAHSMIQLLPDKIGKLREIKERRERWNYMDTFTKEYIHMDIGINGRRRMSQEVKKQYDYFTTGSDQVWNCWRYDIPELNYFFLTFADRSQRITFAPSFGVSEIPKILRKTYKRGIFGFDRLSVREERGKEIIRELTGKEATVLLDPTMLIDTSEWMKILKRPAQYRDSMHEKYILLYSLGQMPKDVKENAYRLGSEMGMETIDLMDSRGNYYTHTRPDEFLYWIYHAKLVVTDSFHGSIFSILFGRPFVVFDRTDLKTMGSRLDTLLPKFGLESRKYNDLKESFFSDDPNIRKRLWETNYRRTEEILEKEREKAARFFADCFSL